MNNRNLITLLLISSFFVLVVSVSIYLASNRIEKNKEINKRVSLEIIDNEIKGLVKHKFWRKPYPGILLVLWVDSFAFYQKTVNSNYYPVEVETLLYEKIDIGDSLYKSQFSDTLFIFKQEGTLGIDLKKAKLCELNE